MLKKAAVIDWKTIGKGLFVTLTYPDSVLPKKPESLTYDRSRFWRDVERYHVRPICGVWRTEWVRRLSGIHTGKLMPHHHFLVFGANFIPHQVIKSIWMKTIGTNEYTRCETKAMNDGEMASIYVAKYCAKSQFNYSLVDASYLNTTGRHYGWLRKERIPLHPVSRFDGLTAEQFRRLIEWGSELMSWIDPEQHFGFTVLGSDCDLFDMTMAAMGLADRGIKLYTENSH